MSQSEQVSLDDYQTDESGADTESVQVVGSGSSCKCNHCDSEVTKDYFRVNANNDGELWACPSCASQGDILRGATISPEMRLRAIRGRSEAQNPTGGAGDAASGASNTRSVNGIERSHDSRQ